MARRRQTIARHAQLRSPGIARQLLTMGVVAVTVVGVAAVGTIAYAAIDLSSELVDGAVSLDDGLVVPPDIGEIEGGVNLVVAGIDECEPEYQHLFQERCSGPDAGGTLNDVNLLLHISDAPRRVTVVSFPRDLILQGAECTRTDGSVWAGGTVQINELYTIGGLPCVVGTLSELSGQDIPFAATATFGGVIEATNAVGGVEVCLARGIRDPHTGIDWPAGPRTVAGIEALQFLRTRYGVGDSSDLARISNQQQYLSRLARTVASDRVLSDPATVYRLASSTLRSITPNDRLANPLTLVQIALAVKDVPFEDITFIQYPTVQASSDANRVQPNHAAATALWDALASNRPLEITGGVALNGGAVEVPSETDAAPDTAAPSPNTEAAVLPPSISGSNAGQQTCSGGNQPE